VNHPLRVIAATAVVFLVIALGHRLLGDGAPPLHGKVVDAAALEECLDGAEPGVKGLRIAQYGIKPMRADPTAGDVSLKWNPEGTLQLSVLASKADAGEVESQLGGSDQTTVGWSNVVMRYSDAPPTSVTEAVYDCSEKAASEGGTDAGFESCDDESPLGGKADHDLRVRGTSCEAGAKLAKRYSFVDPICKSPSRDHLCATFTICCAAVVLYMGNDEEAVVFKSGV